MYVCRINALGEQTEVFSQSSSTGYCPSRQSGIDIIDISSGQPTATSHTPPPLTKVI